MAVTVNPKGQAALQYLMQAGALLGLWFCIEYFVAAQGIQSFLFASVAFAMRIGTIFFLFFLVKKLRDMLFADGFFWIQSWMYGIQLMFFGGLIEAICIYGYCSWINPDFLFELHQSRLAWIESIPELMKSFGVAELPAETMTQFNLLTDNIRELGPDSPITAAMNALSNDIFSGMILMIPISFILRRRRQQS